MSETEPTREPESRVLANMQLSEEQRAAISENTGVDVTELTLIEFKGDAAQALSPVLLAGTAVVVCW